MESSRSKRRRLISSYVSPRRRPDLPAIFESLNDDTLATVLEFVGNKSYRSFGGLNKHCKEIYLASGMTKETFLFGYAPLSVITDIYDSNPSFKARKALSKGVVYCNRWDVLAWALEERNEDVLNRICYVAAEEERFDLLNEVLNNIEDEDDKEDVFHEKEYIFEGVDEYAAENGKLNVLKWIEDKGLDINEYGCACEAVCEGHLHILQWLHEEQGLELDNGDLYNEAILGGHLHVMKWMREQNVPFYHNTIYCYVREEVNLDILQWLHDEGCPWPEHLRVDEDKVVNDEVLDWCRANGYGNRIVSEED